MKDIKEFIFNGDFWKCKNLLEQYDTPAVLSFICALFDEFESERKDFNTIKALTDMRESVIEVHEFFK